MSVVSEKSVEGNLHIECEIRRKKENRSKKNGIEKLTAGYNLLYEQGRKIFCEDTERVSR